MVETICLDMDGTLLNNVKEISDQTKQYLLAFQKQGGQLILASGRTYARMIEYANILQMDKYNGYIIEANGCGVYEMKGHTCLYEKRMDMAQALEIIAYLKSFHEEIVIMGTYKVYCYDPSGGDISRFLENNKNMESLRNRQFYKINDLCEIDEPINKLCISSDANTITKIMRVLDEEERSYWYGRAIPTWLEFCAKATSKGKALQWLLDKTKKTPTTCVAFGDGENDLSMLAVAGYGVAMGNALDSVKASCQYVCETNEENGIIKFLDKIKQEEKR
ncbi:MAG: Cof-type HAD-IIB family hydrolase [Breznakia sp.]